ncbi:asparagine synthase-related protein [Novosphingobium sp. RL4]|uniref:asparagine synthase-related protein n=1 Tax=Novosphingobium sp. RL4 TaxID=3109595 RepID=UPI002D77E919|nr:asparagine synthase-related protein [Novosphingobium sp. RL4]WRT94457.1 asparagine synthase-related protein [Novosphingobium sp. RL4]
MAQRFTIGINLGQEEQARLRSRSIVAASPAPIDRPGLFACASHGVEAIRLLDAGLIVGAVYCRDRMKRITVLPPQECDKILQTNGRRLIERYWGDWVAVIRAQDAAFLLRSPFGALPCLYRSNAGATIVASDIDTLAWASDMANSVDYGGVAFQLYAGDMRSAETCITGVHEVRGGEVAVFSGKSATHETLWSPWMVPQSSRRATAADLNEQILRELAISCVAAKTSRTSNPLVMLSGGLDSSILAACLAARGREFACLNLVAPAAAGDERNYARAVASFAARELTERNMPDQALGLESLPASRLPRPVARGFEQRLFQDAQTVAAELGCDAIVDGGGGDNVFCSLQSASPAADCLLGGHSLTAFWRTCQEIGEMAHASVWHVAWKALSRAAHRSRPYRWSTSSSLLPPAAVQTARNRKLHPWLADNEERLPGRAGQIALLVAAQSFIEDGPAGTKDKVVSPLVSQPLIEHCLSIPSWHWFENGCNRAVARRAFDRNLPHEVVWRRGKGMPDSFVVRMFEANRSYIRDNLLDGLLANEGVICSSSVLRILDDPAPFQGQEFGRIVRLMDAEKWAREIRDLSSPPPTWPSRGGYPNAHTGLASPAQDPDSR